MASLGSALLLATFVVCSYAAVVYATIHRRDGSRRRLSMVYLKRYDDQALVEYVQREGWELARGEDGIPHVETIHDGSLLLVLLKREVG